MNQSPKNINHEQLAENPDNQALIGAAEAWMAAAPLTASTLENGGIVVRELSTASLGDNSDPIEIKSTTRSDETEYELTEWSGTALKKFSWSNNPNKPVGTLTIHGESFKQQPMETEQYASALALIGVAASKFEDFKPVTPLKKQRSAKLLGYLGLGH